VIFRLCRVSGRVQGVYYCASARSQARELGIAGYAANMSKSAAVLMMTMRSLSQHVEIAAHHLHHTLRQLRLRSKLRPSSNRLRHVFN
jgi:acylphosphatase